MNEDGKPIDAGARVIGDRFVPASRRRLDQKNLAHDPIPPARDASIWTTARPEKNSPPVFGETPHQVANSSRKIPGQIPEQLPGFNNQPEVLDTNPKTSNPTSTD